MFKWWRARQAKKFVELREKFDAGKQADYLAEKEEELRAVYKVLADARKENAALQSMNAMLTTKPSAAEPDEALAREVRALQYKAQQAAAEAAYWREQAKALQNQLQQAMRVQSDLVIGLADRPGCENLLEAVAEIKALRDTPITTVAAVEALVASQKPDTQGLYTPMDNAITDAAHDRLKDDSWRLARELDK